MPLCLWKSMKTFFPLCLSIFTPKGLSWLLSSFSAFLGSFHLSFPLWYYIWINKVLLGTVLLKHNFLLTLNLSVCYHDGQPPLLQWHFLFSFHLSLLELKLSVEPVLSYKFLDLVYLMNSRSSHCGKWHSCGCFFLSRKNKENKQLLEQNIYWQVYLSTDFPPEFFMKMALVKQVEIILRFESNHAITSLF